VQMQDPPAARKTGRENPLLFCSFRDENGNGNSAKSKKEKSLVHRRGQAAEKKSRRRSQKKKIRPTSGVPARRRANAGVTFIFDAYRGK